MSPPKRSAITLGDVDNIVTIVTGGVTVALLWKTNPFLSMGAVLCTALALLAINRRRRRQGDKESSPWKGHDRKGSPLETLKNCFEALQTTEMEVCRRLHSWGQAAKLQNNRPLSGWRRLVDRRGCLREFLDRHKNLLDQATADLNQHYLIFKRSQEEANLAIHQLADPRYALPASSEALHRTILEQSGEWFREAIPIACKTLADMHNLMGSDHTREMAEELAGFEDVLADSGYFDAVLNFSFAMAKIGSIFENAPVLWSRYLAAYQAKRTPATA